MPLPMRTALLSASLLLTTTTACLDKNRDESVKHMNAGIENFQNGANGLAEQELEKALALDPENHEAAYNLGQVLENQKKYDKASNAYERALKFGDHQGMYHYKAGKIFMELKQPDKAQLHMEKAVKLIPELFRAHYFLGEIYDLQDKPKEAAAAYTESARLNPSFGKPYYKLGRLYYNWDFDSQAVSVLEQGAKYARDVEDLTNIHFQLGMAYMRQKHLDKAVQAFNDALQAKKDNLDARLQLGLAYAEKGDRRNARKNLDEFIKTGAGGNTFQLQAANERMMKLLSDN
jgi:tetratricopeptide (TPR) repeat protein